VPAAIYVSRPPAVKIAASRQLAVQTNAAKPRFFKHLYSPKAEIQSSTMQEKYSDRSAYTANSNLTESDLINWSIDVHFDNQEGSETHCFVSPTVCRWRGRWGRGSKIHFEDVLFVWTHKLRFKPQKY